MNENTKIPVICENDECKNFGEAFNTITVCCHDEDEFFEGFGHGGECESDYCPKCQELGSLGKPIRLVVEGQTGQTLYVLMVSFEKANEYDKEVHAICASTDYIQMANKLAETTDEILERKAGAAIEISPDWGEGESKSGAGDSAEILYDGKGSVFLYIEESLLLD